MLKRAIQERVRKSALLLDDELPGWHKLINLYTLEMAYGHFCIVGQLRRAGHLELNLNDMDSKRAFYLSYKDVNNQGVKIAEGNYIDRMDYLTQLWKFQIKKRLRCDEKKAIDAMYRC